MLNILKASRKKYEDKRAVEAVRRYYEYPNDDRLDVLLEATLPLARLLVQRRFYSFYDNSYYREELIAACALELSRMATGQKISLDRMEEADGIQPLLERVFFCAMSKRVKDFEPEVFNFTDAAQWYPMARLRTVADVDAEIFREELLDEAASEAIKAVRYGGRLRGVCVDLILKVRCGEAVSTDPADAFYLAYAKILVKAALYGLREKYWGSCWRRGPLASRELQRC